MRVGIHTGLVVLGSIGSDVKHEYSGFGDSMNLAARLQAAAPTDGVIISHDTYRYVRGVFDLIPQPPIMVKGKSAPIQTYIVQRARPRPFRTVTRGVAGIEVQSIGRDAELRKILAAFQKVCDDRTVMWVQIIGEPGMGKSRLLSDARDALDLRPSVSAGCALAPFKAMSDTRPPGAPCVRSVSDCRGRSAGRGRGALARPVCSAARV
jgi:hypothetical protein